ncbi:MAG: hypothetical protein IJH04_10660 [Eggerthellaceae bacterium]|nr:hypothetical protein [Eggerthellaceae bacterium]
MSNLQITGNGGGITAVGGQTVSFGNNYVAGNTTNGAATQTLAPLGNLLLWPRWVRCIELLRPVSGR